MKKSKTVFIVLLALLCTACAKPIMPPLKYNKPIEFHVAKNAALNWEVGKQYSSAMPSSTSYNAGLIGGIVGAVIESADRERRPSLYSISYGKAEQSIFMTSLRDTLEQNHVFKAVELITDPRQAPAKDTLINVYFKTARVSSPEKNYKITLSVEMAIAGAGKSPFKRTYLVESDTGGFGKSVMDQKIDVSQKLLEKMISGIEEWHKQSSKG